MSAPKFISYNVVI